MLGYLMCKSELVPFKGFGRAHGTSPPSPSARDGVLTSDADA